MGCYRRAWRHDGLNPATLQGDYSDYWIEPDSDILVRPGMIELAPRLLQLGSDWNAPRIARAMGVPDDDAFREFYEALRADIEAARVRRVERADRLYGAA
jgi:hypothetical protein